MHSTGHMGGALEGGGRACAVPEAEASPLWAEGQKPKVKREKKKGPGKEQPQAPRVGRQKDQAFLTWLQRPPEITQENSLIYSTPEHSSPGPKL